MTQKLVLETLPLMKFKCARESGHPLFRKIVYSRSYRQQALNSRLPSCLPHPPLPASGSEEPASAQGRRGKQAPEVTDKELFLNIIISFIHVTIPRTFRQRSCVMLKRVVAHKDAIGSAILQFFSTLK